MSTDQDAATLDIWIEGSAADDQLPILISASFDQEDKVGPVRLQLDCNQVQLGLELIAGKEADSETVLNVGKDLFRALFNDEIRDLYQQSRRSADERGLPLRLSLHIASERCAELPWELLHDGQRFLGLDPDTAISRYFDLGGSSPQSLEIQGPLRILVVIAGPANFPDIQGELQASELRGIFGGLQAEGILEVEFLSHATYAGLMRCLRGGDFHILHFMGYCAFDPESRAPVLVFEQEDGKARKVSGDELSRLIRGQYLGRPTEGAGSSRVMPLRLVVINDREVSPGATRNYSAQVAASLLRSGIPAVLDLKYNLPDTATRTFAATFYGAIANADPVDVATAKARDAIRSAVPWGWGAPVLSMHAEDSRIFHTRRAKQLAFEQSSDEIENQIGLFKVRIGDAPTRFFLEHLWLFILLSVAGTLAYVATTWSRRVPDLMFAVIVLAIYTWIWLLRSLLWTRVPATFDQIWRRRLILSRDPGDKTVSWFARVFVRSGPVAPRQPNDQSSLAKQYSDFLDDYNSLLNHRGFPWIMRVVCFVVALFAISRLRFESVPKQWQIVVYLLLVGILGLVAAYVIGTLLWNMIATVIATRRLSYRFRLDMFPGHTDGCNGLKPLGDLYFAHARVLLVPGIITAIVVLVLSLSYSIVVGDLRTNVGGEVSRYAQKACESEINAQRPTSAEFEQRIVAFGGDLDMCPEAPRGASTTVVTLLETILLKTRLLVALLRTTVSIPASIDSPWDCGSVLRCIVYAVPRPSLSSQPSQLVLLAAESLWFYRWFMPYSVLLAILTVLAIVTFVFPMYNTHREMNRMKGEFRRKADSMIGEITELQHSVERFTAISGSEIGELTREWEWLQDRYRQYESPPTWPYDARVKTRLGVTLLTMLSALVTSIIIPMITDFLLTGK